MTAAHMIARLIAVLAAALLLHAAHAVEAAEAAPDDGPRAQLPISTGMPEVRLPRPKQETLGNGMRLLVLEKSSQLPVFTMKLVMRNAGGLHEPAQQRGLADFVAKMLRQGTASRSSQDVARQLETLGVTLDAEAPLGSDDATVSISGLATHLGATLDLLADMVLNPAFTDDEVARHASKKLAELQLRRSRPEFLAQEQLLRAVYGSHPAATAAPATTHISSTKPADLRRFHADHYQPGFALLAVAGDVTAADVLPKVQRLFSAWKTRDVAVAPLPKIPAQRSRGAYLVDRPGSVQTVLQIGALGITRTDADYFALLVMNEVLGGQSSSRLYQNLRERNGYTYGAYSGFSATAIPGLWQVTTSVRTEVTGGAMKELLAELQRIRREPVTPTELANSKRALAGKYIFSLERPKQLLENVITQELYGLPAQYWDEYAANVSRISAADVQRVANRIIDLDHLQIAASGDATKVRQVFAQYGPLKDEADVSAEPQAALPERSAAHSFDFSPEEHARIRRTIAKIADQVTARIARAGEQGQPTDTEDFYDGAPGRYYFLLKAYQALGQQRYLRAAQDGMAELLGKARSDEHGRYFDAASNGVFQGNAGPGYLFLYAHHVTGEQQYLQAAASIARRIVAVPDVRPASLPDIIAGAAGTGLFLLRMHEVTGDALYLQGARRMGEFLIERAETRAQGVTWKLTADAKDYYFVGFAHGPAGIGYFLDQLHHATRDPRYATYADRALAHIEAIAVGDSAGPAGPALKWYHEQLQRSTRFPSQWCHGAPGMNPFFLQSYARTDDSRLLDRARSNTRYLLAQGVDVRKNPGVCHGIAGNAASLALMYRTTGVAEYWREVQRAIDLIYGYIDIIDERPADERDYSYMTGLCGVGDFLIHLDSGGKLNMFGPLGYGSDLSAFAGGRSHADSAIPLQHGGSS